MHAGCQLQRCRATPLYGSCAMLQNLIIVNLCSVRESNLEYRALQAGNLANPSWADVQDLVTTPKYECRAACCRFVLYRLGCNICWPSNVFHALLTGISHLASMLDQGRTGCQVPHMAPIPDMLQDAMRQCSTQRTVPGFRK